MLPIGHRCRYILTCSTIYGLHQFRYSRTEIGSTSSNLLIRDVGVCFVEKLSFFSFHEINNSGIILQSRVKVQDFFLFQKIILCFLTEEVQSYWCNRKILAGVFIRYKRSLRLLFLRIIV